LGGRQSPTIGPGRRLGLIRPASGLCSVATLLLARSGQSPRRRGQLSDIPGPLPRRRTCTPARASDFSSHKRLTGIPLCRVPPPWFYI
jgi:hypothetical protein